MTFTLALSICFIAAVTIYASNNQGRIVIRNDIPVTNRSELLKRLRVITGWRDLRFQNGVLCWDDEETIGGSNSARELLKRTVGGNVVIVLQDASSRSDVAFGRVVPGRWIHNESPNTRAFVVLIDFDDFKQITGDQEARNAFDVGWGLLHEVNHVVNDSADAERPEDVGECEDAINKMRFELGLPLRVTYYFSPLPTKADPEFSTRLVRLAFEKHDSVANRTRRYWLVWDAATVGGFVQTQTAALR